MTKDEALKLALELIQDYVDEYGPHDKDSGAQYVITAIKEALAQPAQEPVAWRYKIVDCFGRPAWTLKTPRSDTRVLESQPIYTTPPQRKPWVGLTEQEHTDIAVECGCMSSDWVFYGATVERLLKEKNS